MFDEAISQFEQQSASTTTSSEETTTKNHFFSDQPEQQEIPAEIGLYGNYCDLAFPESHRKVATACQIFDDEDLTSSAFLNNRLQKSAF